MINFHVINDLKEIRLSSDWVESSKFKSRYKVYNEQGKPVESSQEGRSYRLIAKMERQYDLTTRIGRICKGLFACFQWVVSAGKAISLKQVRQFFKAKETQRFALPSDQTVVCVENGETIYRFPKFPVAAAGQLNFALVKSEGKQKLVPVCRFHDGYRAYQGTPCEALYNMSKEQKNEKGERVPDSGVDINKILTLPENEIVSMEEFYKYLSGREKESDGTPLVFNLNSKSFEAVLKYHEEKKLHEKNSKQDTLHTGKGNSEIEKPVNEMDSSKDMQIDKQKEPSAPVVPQEGFPKPFSEGFRGMNDVFFCTPWSEPDFLGPNLDIHKVRGAVTNYLIDLRKKDLLMTQEEFAKLDQKKYIKKGTNFGRILGRDFVEKIASEEGCKHIKCPKKIAVIHKDNSAPLFFVNSNMELYAPLLGSNQGFSEGLDQFNIWAERITPVKRKLSLEEAIEYAIVMERTGYQQLDRIIAKDGIYFIDTEFDHFDPLNPDFDTIKTTEKLLDNKDVPEFLKFVKERQEKFEQGKAILDKKREYQAKIEQSYKLLWKDNKNRFQYPIDTLLDDTQIKG